MTTNKVYIYIYKKNNVHIPYEKQQYTKKKTERKRRYNKVTECENCALVLNAIFYWGPMEFF